MEAIQSIQIQSYPVLEIIVIDDASTDLRYKTINIPGVIVVRRAKNSKHEYGFVNVGAVRNVGIRIARGDYYAMCDDDDLWLPNKLQLQLDTMKKTNTLFCATEGYYCDRPWISSRLANELQNDFHDRYPLYNEEKFWKNIKLKILRKTGKSELLTAPCLQDSSIFIGKTPLENRIYQLHKDIVNQLEILNEKIELVNTSFESYNSKIVDDVKSVIKDIKSIVDTLDTTRVYRFKRKGKRFPLIWKASIIKKHNSIICSSVVFHKSILEVIEPFKNIEHRADVPEDYELWLRIIKQFPLSYVSEPCFAYGAFQT